MHFEKKFVSINSYSVRRGQIRYDFFTRLLSRKQQTTFIHDLNEHDCIYLCMKVQKTFV